MSQIPHHTVKCRYILQEDVKAEPDAHPEGGPVILNRNPTTSFLTATILIYAIGAGITAAAGTRLALQWFLVEVFKLHSFRMQSSKALIRYFLSLPPPHGDWVICAPAAFLGSGSRFSSSLSGIEP